MTLRALIKYDEIVVQAVDDLILCEPLFADVIKHTGVPKQRLRSDGFQTLLQAIVSQQVSVAAANANSPSIFRGLGELKVKESDRLELIRLNLNKCGCDCKVVNEDLYINPSPKYNIFDNVIKTDFDHRIAMSFAVMGSKIGNLKINQSDSIKTSFPNFLDLFNKAGGNLE